MENYTPRRNEEAATSRHHILDKHIGDENIQKQLDELLAIQSIFDETTLTLDMEKRCGRFIAYPNMPTSKYFIKFNKNISNIQKLEVQHLPCIEFTFALDDFYPSDDPPAFLISCQWLSALQMSQLCGHLDELYNKSHSEILYSWFTFLRDDVLAFLQAENELDVTWCLNDFNSLSNTVIPTCNDYSPKKYRGHKKYDSRVVLNQSTNLLKVLRDYNECRREEVYCSQWFTCNICFSRKQGRDCVIFSCNHTNCVECVSEYFKIQIKEGATYALKCPQHKCSAPATASMIQKVVGEELFLRYDELLLTTALSSMNDIVYCPRKMCQSPVVSETDSDLAVCPVCSFAFCITCKYTYHGVSPCRLFKDEVDRRRILNEYHNGTHAEKEALEKRYGKELLQKEMAAALNMWLSENWINNFSKACPKCRANIEKIDGCNKMYCNRCQTAFCWICLELLSSIDPYSHFRKFKSKCFNKLFAGTAADVNYYEDDEIDNDNNQNEDGIVEHYFEINN